MNAREAALQALLAIERGAEAREALDAALARRAIDRRERRLATQLVYGCTRLRRRLDHELEARLQRRRLSDLPPPIRNVLRLGLFQIRYLDRVPAYAAVGEAVTQARRHGHPGTAALVNAVLRRAAGAPAPEPADPAVAFSHPSWLVQRWRERLGEAETRALLAADNAAPPLVMRVNRLRATREEAVAGLAEEGVEAVPGLHCPEAVRLPEGAPVASLAAFAGGWLTVQDEASMLVGHAVGPWPGWTCLDVAAAPGGKATHLAELMGDTGTVVANDLEPARSALTAATAARLGLRSIVVRTGDARELPREFGGRCDAVLADLPCSGLGSLCRRPDLRWRKEEADLRRLPPLQRDLLSVAADCVRPGGCLVYSTCSTEPEENEEIVAAFLAARRDFRPDPLRLPDPDLAAGSWQVRLWPHRHGTDGFFIARMVRVRVGVDGCQSGSGRPGTIS